METNRLIAEFMGVVKHYEAQSSNMFNQYHTSWDRLVPVIHKILHDNNDSLFFKFSMSVSNAIFNNNIDNAHNAVVEFIKIYNDVRLAEEQEHYDNQNN